MRRFSRRIFWAESWVGRSSEGEGVVLDTGGLGVGEGVVEVQRVGGYISGEDGIGAGAETAVDEVGVGEDTHQEEG